MSSEDWEDYSWIDGRWQHWSAVWPFKRMQQYNQEEWAWYQTEQAKEKEDWYRAERTRVAAEQARAAEYDEWVQWMAIDFDAAGEVRVAEIG